MTTIAPPWSGYPTCSGFTPVYSPSPAPTRAVSHQKRRPKQRGAIRRIPARPVNRVSTVTAKPGAVPPTAIAAVKQLASKAHAAAVNARRAAAASVTTKPQALPTTEAASGVSVSSSRARAMASGVPGLVEKSALGTPTAVRGSASMEPAPRGAARPTRIARRGPVTWGSVSTTSAAPASHAPRVEPACRGCACRRPRHPTDRQAPLGGSASLGRTTM